MQAKAELRNIETRLAYGAHKASSALVDGAERWGLVFLDTMPGLTQPLRFGLTL